MTFNLTKFEEERNKFIENAVMNTELAKSALDFVELSDKHNYGYFWTWNGLPIIQMPEDVLITQEIIWKTKPTVIIELGIAWGGSLAFYAHTSSTYGGARVIGIDKTIPLHNRNRIKSVPYSEMIELWESSSIELKTFEAIKKTIKASDRVMLILDSNHEHSHVLAELNLWSSIVSSGSYIIVADTIVESLPNQAHRKRSWGRGNNPETALRQFLSENIGFLRDNEYSRKTFATFNLKSYIFKT